MDSVEIYDYNYDSYNMVLNNSSWTPPTDEEQFEDEYNNPLRAEIIFYEKNFNLGLTILHHGTGVWALNGDSIKIGIDYAAFEEDGTEISFFGGWVLKKYEWSYNDGSLTLTASDGSYKIWKRQW